MFTKEYVDTFIWFMIGILFIPDHFIMFDSPPTISSRFFILFFLLFTLIKTENLKKQLALYPLKYSTIFILICFLLIGFFDSRLNLNLAKILNRSLGFFLDNFMILLLSFLMIRNFRDVIKTYEILLYIFLIFSIYGVINYITRLNPYMTFICQAFNARDFALDYMTGLDGRYRISSFSWHPIYYGFLLNLIFLMGLLLYSILELKPIRKRVYIGISALVLFNLLMVNSRTPLFAFLGGVAVFFIWGTNLRKKIQFFFIGSIFTIFILSFVPKVGDFIDDSLNTFSSKGSSLEGSSVEMRNVQLASSIFIFNRNPITGNGFYYITENLGFKGRSDERSSDSSFAGFESYLYKLLIEQGIIGIVGHLVFFGSLILYFLSHAIYAKNKVRKQFAVLNIAMVCSFFLFIFGTGDLGTFKFFMPIMGINLKGLEYLKFYEKDII
ncbi:hypothetical protein ABID42_002449 [Arcicella rosea]|uniref:O-antigen ligase family protein n=1 Tax=Arcicella rosea TaxID=502909 RepID=UPI00345D58C7